MNWTWASLLLFSMTIIVGFFSIIPNSFAQSPADVDFDGIFNEIDLELEVFSDDFDDTPIGGTSDGAIITRGDQNLMISEEDNPTGVKVNADLFGGLAPATVEFCSAMALIDFDPGDELVVTCSSVTVNVLSGSLSITFFGTDGTEATTNLTQGNGITFDQTTFSFTAPATNTETVIISVNGEVIQVLPGDNDGDEIPNEDDNCQFVPNPNQEDVDENGIGDACQDVDGDEFLDLEDNCPFIPNPAQIDTNENGIGDACEEQELLVEATFPPGDTIEVDLPEDPNTGSFSISLELPEEEGGEVVIEITDAGDTGADFSFLGSIIDFNAPCTNNCVISFTFTQELLDEQGLTLAEVTIFHDGSFDGVHNLSFEANEAIPTAVTDNGDGTFTATATASFTSKFSIGGIKALALGALVGGGSRGGAPPSLESISFSGVKPGGIDDTIEFGGILIDEILSENNLPTQTIETGELFKLRLPFYEDSGVKGIQHVAVYFLQNDDETINDSETFVIYEPNNPLQISDPFGYTSAVSVEIIEKSTYDIDIIFEMTFQNPMNKSDIIIRSWDNHKRSSDIKFNQLIQVIESDNKNKISFQPIIVDSDLTQTVESSVIKSITVLKQESDESLVTLDIEEGQSITNIKIPKWIKYNANWWSQEEIDDDDFVAGLQFLIDSDLIKTPEIVQAQNVETQVIPTWIKYNAGWWSEGYLSDDEFMQAIQWLIEKQIILLFALSSIDAFN